MKSFLKALLKSPAVWVLFLFLEPTLAHAASLADNSIFSIPPGDLAKQYLDRMFPADGVSSPFSSILLVINSAVMLIAGGQIAWIVLHNAMSAANTGEFSKKHGSAWMPLRIALGSAGMVPIKGGLCGATLVVLYVFQLSIGLGDTLYLTWMKNNASLVFATSPVPKDKARTLMLEMLKDSVCTASYAKANNQHSLKYFTESGKTPEIGITERDSTAGLELLYGNSSDPSAISACGRILLTAPTDAVQSNLSADSPMVQALTNVQNTVWAQKKIAFLAAQKTIGADASSFIFNHTKVLPGIETAISDYEKTVNRAVAKVATDNNVLKQINIAQTKNGWMGLGSTYLSSVQFQQSLSQIAGSFPAIKTDTGKDVITDDTTKYDLLSLQGEIARENADPTSQGDVNAAVANQDDDGGFLAAIKDPMGYISKKVVHNLSNGNFFSGSESTSPNMLLSAVAIGGKLLDTADVLLALPFAFIAVPPALIPILGITLPISGILLTAGVTLSVFVPLEPYVLWVGICLSIFITLLESVFASPFFMLSHLMDGGSEEVGAAEQGWKLMLQLFLAIPLAVISFAVSMTLLQVGSDFVNATIGDAFNMSRGSDISIWMLLGLIILFTTLMVSVVKICFSEIYFFADSVSKWLGLSMQSITSHAQEVKSHAGQHNTAILGGVITAKQSAVRGAGDLKNAMNTKKITDDKNENRNAKGTERTYTPPVKPGDTKQTGEDTKPKPEDPSK